MWRAVAGSAARLHMAPYSDAGVLIVKEGLLQLSSSTR
jgi:hypothetical protein